MGPLDFLVHASGFLAPAAFLALVLPLLSRLFWRGRQAMALPWQAGLVFAAGAAVLVLGLWGFGRDGKAATYGALVLATASVQWLALRAWR